MPRPGTEHLHILGTRGIPAGHGGFETFAEEFARYAASRNARVVVYCPSDVPYDRQWNGIRLVGIKSPEGALGSVLFDLKANFHSSRSPATKLVLGYNTAILNLIFNLRRRTYFVNMDGIEWQRRKWGPVAKAWFWINERVAARSATGLIADHPAIADHLKRLKRIRPITMIPYGSRRIVAEPVNSSVHKRLGLGRPIALVIARPEPENSILEMVKAWSRQAREADLVILGNYSEHVPYQAAVLAAASEDVRFVGPIYDKSDLDALRASALFYMYGHTVGGTSPTLVEALGAGNPVLALDTVYSRWVCGLDSALYFNGEDDCSAAISALLGSESRRARMSRAASTRHADEFTWDHVLSDYDKLLGVTDDVS